MNNELSVRNGKCVYMQCIKILFFKALNLLLLLFTICHASNEFLFQVAPCVEDCLRLLPRHIVLSEHL